MPPENPQFEGSIAFLMSLLILKDLLKSYPSEGGEMLEVVNIPLLEIAPGEQLLLRGESGLGKSTLLNLIAGIVAADSGEIILEGEDLAALSESDRDVRRARSMGYVFQNFNLLEGYSCLENVELGMSFGGRLDRDFARQLLERVGLGGRLSYRPSQLSQGQKQRVAIARALANRPKLVLADEPTGNLDPSNAAVAMDLMQSLCRENGTALLLVSHDASISDRFEKVADLASLNKANALAVGEGEAL